MPTVLTPATARNPAKTASATLDTTLYVVMCKLVTRCGTTLAFADLRIQPALPRRRPKCVGTTLQAAAHCYSHRPVLSTASTPSKLSV